MCSINLDDDASTCFSLRNGCRLVWPERSKNSIFPISRSLLFVNGNQIFHGVNPHILTAWYVPPSKILKIYDNWGFNMFPTKDFSNQPTPQVLLNLSRSSRRFSSESPSNISEKAVCLRRSSTSPVEESVEMKPTGE